MADDLENVFRRTSKLWEEVRGQRLFLTGGTGFFGQWLLETFLHANDRLELKAQVTVLTRQPKAFAQKAHHLVGNAAVSLHPGDVRDFEYPDGRFAYVIHAATPSSAVLNECDPAGMFDTIVAGTRRALDFAVRCEAQRFLLTSSGAVYGAQPPAMLNVPEEYGGGPDPAHPRSAYAEGKRAAEFLCAAYGQMHGLEACIARGFAFTGPYLPLNIHFAIGNFIRDQLNRQPIRVMGDGTPFRSYLYAADLAVWLWTILLRGRRCRPYNVGSERAVSIAQLAEMVAVVLEPRVPVITEGTPVAGRPAARYVPSTARARTELGLTEEYSLEDAIRRTASWYAAQSAAACRGTRG